MDNDPQSNLTTTFGVENPDQLQYTLHELLLMGMDGQELPPSSEYIQKKEVSLLDETTATTTLDLLPASLNLTVTELNLRDELDGVYA